MSYDDSETHLPSPDAHPLTSTEEPTVRRQDANIGIMLKSRYVIEKELGRGGIGVVYLAHDNQLLHKPVVIKVLLAELGDSEEHIWQKRKFRQEIEALARIDHPGVVGALDVGQMPDGKQYLVMQFVEGANLRSAMNVEGMEFDRAAGIIRQIGQALNAAHDKGVYHRDLKPENIMLQTIGEGEEYAKLIDFGIATVKDSQMSTNRQTTAIAGTLAYMAPEQLMGKPVPASDIYAFGIIAYEMLTGRKPFYPESPYKLYEMQRAGVRIKPVDLRQGIPESAQEIILRALSFDPRNRQTRAREFGEALAQALSQSYSSDSQAETLISPAREAMTAAGPTGSDGTRTGLSKLRLVLLCIAALVIFFVGLNAIRYLTYHPDSPPTPLPVSQYFNSPNPNLWKQPSSGWRFEYPMLHIWSPPGSGEKPEIGFWKEVNFDNYKIKIRLRLENGVGAAWALRVQDSKNYYLFYLSGPEPNKPDDKNRRLFFYIVSDDNFDKSRYEGTPLRTPELRAGAEYIIYIKVNENLIEHIIQPVASPELEESIEHANECVPLEGIVDLHDKPLRRGTIGFASIDSADFSITEVHVVPLSEVMECTFTSDRASTSR